ncbi:MAG: hypothetical protein LBH22_09585 [Bacteroidales bacterium]|jgi:hypothetical protein|nr:hypothetical protein [Bacteroidales bacterium]
MLKLGRIEIVLDGMAYFGILSPLLKAYNLAHFINKFFDIELAKTLDFEKYEDEQIVDFPCYMYVSEIEQCSYHLIGNKNEAVRLFSNYPEMDFWFLVQFENGLNDHRFLALKEKLYNDLTQVEGVFLVVQVEQKKLASIKDFEDFKMDFSEYCRKLLPERTQPKRRTHH